MSTMTLPLQDISLVEVSAFIAAPLGGMTLAQLGADVIRIDPIGGNIDINRWPLAPDGTSLYWAGLNKAKRSVTLALNTPQGQEIARALICQSGNLLTNLPASGWMSHAELSQHRADLIMMRLVGNTDGGAAIDYTVNCASGFPIATGPDESPINHVLPAWDIAAGLYLSTGFLAAERMRQRSGQGQEIVLSLADVMLANVSSLGYVADVQINGAVRSPMGNDLYGAFGRDFATAEEITARFDGSGVLWGPYQNFGQLVHEDWRCSPVNPMFALVDQPGVGEILTNAVPLDFRSTGRLSPARAPRLGEHTEEVLTGVLGLSSLQFAQLVDAGVAQ